MFTFGATALRGKPVSRGLVDVTTTRGTAVTAAEQVPGVRSGPQHAQQMTGVQSGPQHAQPVTGVRSAPQDAEELPGGDADPTDSGEHDLDLATRFRPIMLRLDLLVRRHHTQY